MSVVQVTPVVHDVPVTHTVITGSVGGIEVGQSQAVSELVAEGAHTVDACAIVIVALQFVEHGIPVDGHAIELERTDNAATPIIGFLHVPLARPNALRHIAIGLCLAHAGIEHNDNINIAVIIVVIVRKIQVTVNTLTGIIDHRT